jgi:2-polyprenyl-3-methyl-5-hydroxy-6-metoxy-1,4-benzoquinol methylase
MTPAENYALDTIDHRNPIKRWSHRARFELALRIIDPQPGETIFDYGTGDAYLLRRIKERSPLTRCVGYDPSMDKGASSVVADYPDVQLLSNLESVKDAVFPKVTCFETLEHFHGSYLDARIDELANLAAPGGMIVVSVPIEVGPASLLKNIVRAQIGGLHAGITLAKIMASAWYSRRVERGAPASPDGFINSHFGFNYRIIPPAFERRGFRLAGMRFSPFPVQTDLVNSQVFFRFTKN